MTGPAEDLLASIPAVASGLGSYDRIQNFLRTPTWDDGRTQLVQMPKSDTTIPLIPANHSHNATVQLGNIPMDSTPSPGSIVISAKNATLRPALDTSPVINEISFSVESGSILMIVGPVGAGKTTLVKGLLGEIACDRGNFCVQTSRVSYCA